MTEPPATADVEDDIPEQLRVRREKRERLLASGRSAVPGRGPAHRTPSPRSARSYADLEADTATGDVVGVAGRVVFIRNTGKLCFATLQAGDGSRSSRRWSRSTGVGEEALAALEGATSTSATTSFVTGEVISSRRGELSVMVDDWAIAAKALRPLPNMHNGARPRRPGSGSATST